MWVPLKNTRCQIKRCEHNPIMWVVGYNDFSTTWQHDIWTVWTFCHLQVIGFCMFCVFSFLLCKQPVSVQLHISGCNKLCHLGLLGMWRSKSFGIFVVITFLLKQCNWYFNISDVLPDIWIEAQEINAGMVHSFYEIPLMRSGVQNTAAAVNSLWVLKV